MLNSDAGRRGVLSPIYSRNIVLVQNENQYDALGRRITKHAQAVYHEPLGDGSVYIHKERARVY